MNHILSEDTLPPERLRNAFDRIEALYRAKANDVRAYLIECFGVDPESIGASSPIAASARLSAESRSYLRYWLYAWDIVDHLARQMMIARVGASVQGEPSMIHAGSVALRQTLDQIPFLLSDRLTNPLFPEQKMMAANDLAGLVATKLAIPEPYERGNQRLRVALEREAAIQGDGTVPSDALYEQLPGAVLQEAKSLELRLRLEEFRDLIAHVLEGGEADAGQVTQLTDKMLTTEFADRRFDPSEMEEFAARATIREQEETKAIERLAEFRIIARLSRTQDRVLDMWLNGMSLEETARNLGSMTTISQVKGHRDQIRKKLQAATGELAS